MEIHDRSKNLIRCLFFKLNSTTLKIKLDFRLVLMINFLVFGFYGWGTTKGLSIFEDSTNLFVTLALVTTSTIIYLTRESFSKYYPHPITLKLQYLILPVVLISINLIVNKTYITRSLTTDELAYSWVAQSQAYVILINLIKVSPYSVSNLTSSVLLHIISVLILVSLLLYMLALNKIKRDSIFFIVILLTTLLAREAVKQFGGNPSPNSPLSSIWYFLFSCIFGSQNFTFRLATISAFAFFFAYILTSSSVLSLNHRLNLFLVSLLHITIPFISHMSAIVEIANWNFLISVYVITYLLKSNFHVRPSLLIFLAIAFYVRVNTISLFISVLVIALIQSRKLGIEVKTSNLYSGLVIFPGLVYVLLSRFKGRVLSEGNFLNELQLNINNTTETIVSSRSIPYFILALLFTGVLLKNRVSAIFIAVYHLVNVVLYLCLNTVTLSSLSKYQIEFLFPSALGFLLYIVIRQTFYTKKQSVLVALLLVLLNSVAITDRDNLTNSYKRYYHSDSLAGSAFKVLTYEPHKYQESFKYLEARDILLCFNAGATYSVFPEIMSGQRLKTVLNNKEIRSEILKIQTDSGESWTTISDKTLTAAKVDCVILGAVDYQGEVVKSLVRNRWKIVKTFSDNLFGTQTFILTRTPNHDRDD